MIQENGFKETDIGVIPEDWGLGTLGSLFDIQQGKSVSPKSRKGISLQPFLRTANVFWGQIDLTKLDQMDFNDTEINKLSLKADDLLICEGGDIGRTAIWENQIPLCMYQNHLHRLRTNRENVIPRFYMYWMQASLTLFGLYEGTGNKTTIPNLSMSRLSSFVVPVPEKKEQLFIVLVMNKIQQAIAQQEKIIEKTKELKRSLMHRLFTYGLRGEELKETEIGLMPKSWEVFSISQKCLVKGSTIALTELPLLDTKNTQHELVHGIKVSDMNTGGNEKSINRANIIAHLSNQDAIKKAVPRNSIVFPKRGAAIATNKKRLTTSWTVLDPNLIAIIPNEDINAEYLYYWFLIFDLRSIQDPGPTPQLNKKDVNPIRFPCPSIEEQKQISSFLSIIDSRHSLSEQKKNCLNELFKSMLQLLMTGQVRVKDIDFGGVIYER